MIIVEPISYGFSEVLANNTGSAWYDGLVNTVESESFALSLSIQPGALFDSVVLLNLTGTEVTIEILDDDGGAQVFLQTYSLDNVVIEDWYDYFFSGFDFAKELVLTGLPAYFNGVVNITIQPAGDAAVGMVLVGPSVTLGETEKGLRFGVRDYSIKEVAANGDVTITQGNFAKRLEGETQIEQSLINFANGKMTDLRATPAAWVPSTSDDFKSMVTYGYVRDWTLTPIGGELARLTFSIEGLI